MSRLVGAAVVTSLAIGFCAALYATSHAMCFDAPCDYSDLLLDSLLYQGLPIALILLVTILAAGFAWQRLTGRRNG